MASTFATFRAPLYVAWELTHRCNARCVHCYSASGPRAPTARDLSTTESIGVVDQLADAGVLVLALSGGEPMLRRDWWVIASHAVTRGLNVNIGTNGSSITPRNVALLSNMGIKSVTVSLDSHVAETHDAFRRLPGLHAKAVRAVQLLSERGIRVVVGFTPTRLNWRDGPEVIALAARIGATAVNLSEYVPAGRGTVDLAIAPEKLRQVLQTWILLREQYSGKIGIMWHDCRVGMLVSEADKRDYVGCGAGRLVARILPDGTVTPCVFLPTAIGSLREACFSELWRNSKLLLQFRQREGHISGNCGECEHLKTCGGCRAVAYAYSGGDPLAGDPHCWVKPGDRRALRVLQAGEELPV
ncbi:MAG TPA: radical SAM protein [Polyangiaceae bacterium]|nr:radical SAM protein [Polyangiaceae bacterium]